MPVWKELMSCPTHPLALGTHSTIARTARRLRSAKSLLHGTVTYATEVCMSRFCVILLRASQEAPKPGTDLSCVKTHWAAIKPRYKGNCSQRVAKIMRDKVLGWSAGVEEGSFCI